MTTFWKPTPDVGPDRPNGPVTKKLGNRVYVLWCRCDICHRSDSSFWFEFFERGSDHGEICDKCLQDTDCRKGLLDLGWKTTGPHYTTR